MLKAAESGKYRGTVLAGETGEGRQGLLEDLLTSSVFERIRYLPDEVISSLFDRITLSARAHDSKLGEFQSMFFWPQHALNGRRVEPDVVVEFEELVVGIEAKRTVESVVQTVEQLLKQFDALRASYGADEGAPKAVIVIALGGRPVAFDGACGNIVQIDWRDLWEHLKSLALDGASARIVEDIQTALELANVRTKDRWPFLSLRGVGLGSAYPLYRRWRTGSPPRPLGAICQANLTAHFIGWSRRNGN